MNPRCYGRPEVDPPGLELESWVEASPRAAECAITTTAPATVVHRARNYSLLPYCLEARCWWPSDGYTEPVPVLTFVPEDEPYSGKRFEVPGRRSRASRADTFTSRETQADVQPGLKEGDEPRNQVTLWVSWAYGVSRVCDKDTRGLVDWPYDFHLEVDVYP